MLSFILNSQTTGSNNIKLPRQLHIQCKGYKRDMPSAFECTMGRILSNSTREVYICAENEYKLFKWENVF